MVEQNFLLINVLPRDMFQDCHIRGSISVPLDQLESFAHKLDVNQKVVVYCASYACRASVKAWRLLDTMGFQNLWAYEGGMAEWYHKGLPFEGSCQASYLMGKIEKPSGEAKDVKLIYAEELMFLLQENGIVPGKE